MYALPNSPFLNQNRPQYQPTAPSPLSSSPTRPPLSPLNPNVRLFSMSSPPPAKPIDWSLPQAPSTTKPTSRFSKRPTKSNPLMERKGGDDGRETRRNLFLKRVRKDSEDKRWEERGGEDEIMRVVWLGEEKRRRDRIAQEAEGLKMQEDDALESDGHEEKDMVENVALQEDAEIDAYLDMLESERQDGVVTTRESGDTPYGSDEDEYDDIFMQVITNETPHQSASENAIAGHPVDEDAMDLS